MSTTIKCSNCDHEIEITAAIRKELEEKILHDANAKHTEEVERLKKEAQAELKAKEQEVEAAKEKMLLEARKEAIDKVRKEYDAKIEATKEESKEREKQNYELQEQIKELFKELREARDAKGKLEIEFQKKLLEEEERIKVRAKKETEEEVQLKIAEKEKKLQDAIKANEELRRKLEQGSQQLQGEVQELQLEETLRAAFPFDDIQEVGKGVRGADVIQVVKTNTGIVCGSIVWESKNTKNWTAGWIPKLKEDQRALKAEVAVIVSKVLPEGITSFGLEDGVWVSDLSSVLGLAHALRQQLMMVHRAQVANMDKASKAEVVYNYLISNEFKQRIEVWVEYFQNRTEELQKEKLYFTKKWEKEEKSIMKILQNTAGIYGDLQGLIGNALPKVQYLELPEEDMVG